MLCSPATRITMMMAVARHASASTMVPSTSQVRW
jgi:hypothetical protein